MFVPLLLGGLAIFNLLQAGENVAKTIENFDTADRLKEEAERELKKSKKELDSAIKAHKKLSAEIAKLHDWLSHRVLNQIKSKNSIMRAGEVYLKVLEEELKRLGLDERARHEYLQTLSTGEKLLVSGGASALIASTVPAIVKKSLEEIAKEIGVSSTGKMIGQLTGVAQKNAIYAWLGGGAKSAGGLGMAGGRVLSGAVSFTTAISLITIPIWLISEIELSDAQDYASKLKRQAFENKLKAELLKLETKAKRTHFTYIKKFAMQTKDIREMVVLLISLGFLLKDDRPYKLEEKYSEVLQRVEEKTYRLIRGIV